MKKALRVVIVLSVLLVGAVSSLAYGNIIAGAGRGTSPTFGPGAMVVIGAGMLALAIYNKRRNNV